MKFWIPIAAVALAMVPLAIVHPVRVTGRSMEPGFRDGSIHLAWQSWCAGRPSRGEVWLIDGPGGLMVKRVIGLPGERLEQRSGMLCLNGPAIPESYVQLRDIGDAGPWDTGTGYFLVGDNRPISEDSRAWGPLPRSAFLAKLAGY